MMKDIQRVVNKYYVFSALTMVTNFSANDWNSNKQTTKMAHMCVNVISKHNFMHMIAKNKKNTADQIQKAKERMHFFSYTQNMPSFRLEGTAPTLPISYNKNIVHTIKDSNANFLPFNDVNFASPSTLHRDPSLTTSFPLLLNDLSKIADVQRGRILSFRSPKLPSMFTAISGVSRSSSPEVHFP